MSHLSQPYLVVIDAAAVLSAPAAVQKNSNLQGLELLALRYWAGFSDSTDAYAFVTNCPVAAKIVDNSDGHFTALIADAQKATQEYKRIYLDYVQGIDISGTRAAAYNALHTSRINLEGQLP